MMITLACGIISSLAPTDSRTRRASEDSALRPTRRCGPLSRPGGQKATEVDPRESPRFHHFTRPASVNLTEVDDNGSVMETPKTVPIPRSGPRGMHPVKLSPSGSTTPNLGPQVREQGM